MYRISAPPCPAGFPLSEGSSPPVALDWSSPPVPLHWSSPPVPLSAYAERGNYGLPTRDRSDHEKRLRPRRHGIGKRGVRRGVRQVSLAREEPQERPAPLGDVVADRAAQHGIPRLERVQHRAPGDPAGDVEGHLAFHLRPRAQVRREHHADHASVWTSTDSTAGRSRTMGAQLSPPSADPYPCPPLVPQ